MAWSSYAHLPNNKEEYFSILSKLKNNMTIQEIDNIIAVEKQKIKVQHHYRSSLAKIGFFSIHNNKLNLHYTPSKIKENFTHITYNIIDKNQDIEVRTLKELILKNSSYDLNVLIKDLLAYYPLIQRNNFIRWLRPLSKLLEYANILDVYNRTALKNFYMLQNIYNEISQGNNIPIEELEHRLKQKEVNADLCQILHTILDDLELKFNIELLMLPNWASNSKIYKINDNTYTHIKIEMK